LLKNDPKLVFALVFYDYNDNLLMVSDMNDSGKIFIESFTCGKYRLEVLFPKNIFISNSYHVELICYHHLHKWLLPLNNQTKIKFDFFNDTELNRFPNETRFGNTIPLSPVLEWIILKK